MAQQPWFECAPLPTGLAGNVEIPTLGTDDGRTVYCVYSQNVSSIWIQRTTDAGRSWSAAVQVMGLPAPTYITDANVLVDGQRVTVFATHVLESADTPGKIAHSVIQVAVSEDGGSTWSPPTPLPLARRYVCGCIHAPVWLDGYTVVMGYSWDVPAEEGRPAADEGGMFLKAGVLISHDRGRTWTPGGDVEVPTFPIGADEPALVRLGTGELLAVLRGSGPRPSEARSADGGLTWSAPEPSAFYGCNSPAALLRLRDGALLRAWDNSPTPDRFPLVVALSTDDARSWTPPATIAEPAVGPDGEPSFRAASYPTIAEAADGTILLAWWQVATDGSFSVQVARCNRAWVEATAAQPPPLRIVAFGDSVTLGSREGVHEYQTFRHLVQQRLRNEGLQVEVLNAGIGGDNTRTALERLDRDVLAARPQVAIVMFGINDAALVDAGPVARTEPRVPLEEYGANLRTIITGCRAAGTRVLLCTPTPMSRRYVYQDVGAYATHENINFLLAGYAQAAREVAASDHCPLVDLYALFTDRPDGLDLIEDGNHPYARGHRVIADALLEPLRKLLSEAAPGERP